MLALVAAGPFIQLYVCGFALTSRRYSNRWEAFRLQSTSFSSSEDLNSKLNEVTQDAAQLSAVAALQKLKARQEMELEETERMIQVVKREFRAATQDKSSTAASLLSGYDYGFVSRSEGAPSALSSNGLLQSIYSGPPGNILVVGWGQFMRNLNAMKGEYSDEPPLLLNPRQTVLQEKLKQLELNTTEIWAREFADGPIEAPLVIKVPYLAVCFLLDVVFDGRYVPSRFFLLETGTSVSMQVIVINTSTICVLQWPGCLTSVILRCSIFTKHWGFGAAAPMSSAFISRKSSTNIVTYSSWNLWVATRLGGCGSLLNIQRLYTSSCCVYYLRYHRRSRTGSRSSWKHMP